MPGSTGPDLNTYTIPEVQLGDTFNYWRDTTNTAIYKLNKMRIYDAVDGPSIGVTYGTTGAWKALLQPTITSGHTFSSLIAFSGGFTSAYGFVSGGFTVGGGFSAARAFVSGGLTANYIFVSNGLTLAGGLLVGGAATLSSTLSVAGLGTFTAGATTASLWVGGGSTFAGKVNIGVNNAGASLGVSGSVNLFRQSGLYFFDADDSNWLQLKSPATVGSNVTWTLPNVDGASGNLLSTNGTGTLSWLDAGICGANRQIQYNVNGKFGATAGFVFHYDESGGYSAGTLGVCGGAYFLDRVSIGASASGGVAGYGSRLTIRGDSGNDPRMEVLIADAGSSGAIFFNASTGQNSWNGLNSIGTSSLIYTNGSINGGCTFSIVPWHQGYSGLLLSSLNDSRGTYIGINQEIPKAYLHVGRGVYGSTSDYCADFTSSGTTAGWGGVLFSQDLTNAFKLWTNGTASAVAGNNYMFIDLINRSTGLTVGARPAPIMSIRGSGLVGIGTSTPGASLDVVGNVRISSGLTAAKVQITGTVGYTDADNTLATKAFVESYPVGSVVIFGNLAPPNYGSSTSMVGVPGDWSVSVTGTSYVTVTPPASPSGNWVILAAVRDTNSNLINYAKTISGGSGITIDGQGTNYMTVMCRRTS